MISRIIQFIGMGIWEIRLKDLHPLKAFPIKYLRIFILAVREFDRDQCRRDASALTYYSLLNIVPLMAVVFAIAKGFGLEKLIQNQILQIAQKANWEADVTTQILNFSRSLLENARGGLIAGVGVILLFWTVISIFGKIENSFNTIWEVKRSRTLVRKFSDYLAMMVLAPILFIVSSSVTVVAASQIKVIVNRIELLGIFSHVIFFFLKLLPYFSMSVLLTVFYVVMPNTRVRLRSGILAGIVAGIIYQMVQWIYIKFQIGVARYGAVYGSFAALPLFLAWLQLSWMIVLFGAEVAFANENAETYGFQPNYSQMSFSSKKLLMLRIFHLIVKRFSMGERPLTAHQIGRTLEIPVRLVRKLLNELTDTGLITENTTGQKDEIAFQPGRTIDHITVKHALDLVEECGSGHLPLRQPEEAQRLSNYLKEISEAIEKSPGNVPLKEI
jgi:membrane protein